MNLKEVEKHVKFDMFLTALIYIMIAVCLFLALIFTLAIPAKAASNNINSNSHSTCGNSMGSGSYYGAFQNGTCYSRAIGTTYSGQASLVGFWLNYNFQAGKYYTITINFKDNDLLSSTIVDVVRVVDVANSNEWTSTYNFISKKQFKVYFLASNNTSSLAISLASGSGDPITGISNYGISSVYLEDNDNSDEIINANNQNTQNIINNNNANASDTQNVIISTNDKIMNQIADRCPNLADWPNTDLMPIVVQADHNDTYIVTNNTIELTSGVRYYYNISTGNQSESEFFFLYQGGYADFFNISTGSGSTMSGSFIAPRTGSYTLRADCNISGETCTYYNFYISTVERAYCPFGSSLSKLDTVNENLGWIGTGLSALGYTEQQIKDLQTDIKNTQQQQYNYLTDDTNPSVNTTGIGNVMDSVEITDPLNYLLTLPISLLQKLNTILSANSCSRVSFGSLYNTELYLPCINFEQILGSTIWGTIDLIVGVALLAVIFKRFYDSISNVLTLGKEKEVRDKLDLPTPMQFLASILGGGRD